MNDEQRKRDLRKWAVEMTLKMEYPLTSFIQREKPKTIVDMLFSSPHENRIRTVLYDANLIYAFVEDCHYGLFLKEMAHNSEEKQKAKK